LLRGDLFGSRLRLRRRPTDGRRLDDQNDSDHARAFAAPSSATHVPDTHQIPHHQQVAENASDALRRLVMSTIAREPARSSTTAHDPPRHLQGIRSPSYCPSQH
jgi:hypothetical protein